MALRRDILRDRLGVWVWETSQQPILRTVQRAKRHGYNWIAVKAQEGTGPHRLSSQHLDAWRAACHQHGLQFGIWGFLYGRDAEAEANQAAELVNHHGAQFYIADAEAGYENNGNASREFASRFQRLHPHLPKALSSFGRIDFHPIDWHAWKRHGFTFMPQAYVDVSQLLRPSTCIQVASHIWHPSEMAVTLEMRHGLDYSRYVREAARLGVRGFNVWRADLVSDSQLTEIHNER